MRYFSSLRASMLIIVLFAVIPAMALIAYTGFEVRERLIQDTKEDALYRSSQAAQQLTQLLEGLRYLLVAIARDDAIRYPDPAAASRHLTDLMGRFNHLANLGATDAAGIVFASGIPLAGPVDLSERLYVKKALQLRTFVCGEYQVGKITGIATINFGYPLLDSVGAVKGVVYAALKLNHLQTVFSALTLPQGGDLTVLDMMGKVLYSSLGDSHKAGETFPNSEIIRADASASNDLVAVEGKDGVRRIYARHPVEGVEGISILVGLPEKQAVAAANRALTRNLVLLGIVSLLALGLTWALGYLFVMRRINALVAASDLIASGEYGARTGLSHVQGELGHLAGSFDSMAMALQGRDLELKKNEREINHMRLYLQNIINSMPSVLVGVDTEGQVTQWNLEAEKTTGISSAEAQGKHLHDVFPRLDEHMAHIRQAIAQRTPQTLEKIAIAGPEETLYYDIVIYPLIRNGVEGAVIRRDDITNRVRIENMMVQTEKMTSIAGLAAGTAHEINNPLASIIQNLQVVRNRIFDDLPKNRAAAGECGITLGAMAAYMDKRGIPAMIDDVMASGSRAAQIVENMLSFSRKEDSRGSLHSLAELLDKALELAATDYDMKKKYDFRKIDIIKEYAPDAPPAYCIANKIEQVFLNILGNGAHAMGGKNEEGYRPRFILRVMRHEEMARVEIEDNGPGMDEATRTRVFEPFFTTKDPGIGTGLGLSVSYFIITNNHKGTMTVESSLGLGAKFIVCLPLERKL